CGGRFRRRDVRGPRPQPRRAEGAGHEDRAGGAQQFRAHLFGSVGARSRSDRPGRLRDRRPAGVPGAGRAGGPRLRRFTSVEQRTDAAARRVLDGMPRHGLSGALVEFVVFGLKQAWACLFGGALLALIVATKWFWPDAAPLARYDFLFLAALGLQAALL